MAGSLTNFLREQLKKIDPTTQYSGRLPKIQSSTGHAYFVKSGSPSELGQFVGEAQSLEAIENAAPGLAPKLISHGRDAGGRPYFISEYKDLGGLSGSAANVLAKRLATELHQYKSQKGFGFDVPTFCGATRQKNGWCETWEQCYDSMIGNLLEGLSTRGYDDLVKTGEKVREYHRTLKSIGQLNIQPVLLHGDLWSGNVGVDSSSGQPVIFDPSSYYGHNEAEAVSLAIARIFGGFPQSFYDTYHQHCPKTEPVAQYGYRAQLYELYHYLNHTLLFGGGYARSAQGIMNKLLEAAPGL
ncbi:Protein-ribulosamine 3-kinase, chloroplastic [Leucoagaricus sp. SymC.cos]|nr:Protein-ribulosamine 3-kinase, chloroplastic [Leucoagaricus sp. SymC.cos]